MHSTPNEAIANVNDSSVEGLLRLDGPTVCYLDFSYPNPHYTNVSKTTHTSNDRTHPMWSLGPVFMIALLWMACSGGGGGGDGDTGSPPLCTTNADCEAEQICASAKCWTQAQQCTKNGDCPAGQTCTTGYCFDADATACTNEGDCGPLEKCNLDKCWDKQCTADVSCNDGESCIDGMCYEPAPPPTAPNDTTTPDGTCVPVCEGKFCGPDGCGGTCPDICDGICNPETGACSTETQCEPDCTNKACGDDGCGGECPDLCEGVCNEQTGTCDDERTPVNGCTSEVDEHIYEFQNVNQSALVCMTESDNNPAEATACLGNETGLSPACQECWSGFFHCVFEDCVASCATDPGDDGCGQCHQSTCLSAYETCAGRSMDWN